MNLLGNTLQLISAEKAGIIKPGIPVIIGEYQPEVADIFIKKAKEEGSRISFASELKNVSLKSEVSSLKSNISQINEFIDIKVTSASSDLGLKILDFRLDLTGIYQLKNVKTVLCMVDELRLQGFHITDTHIKTALSQVKNLTGLHGRWEILTRHPLTICDTGHNPEGVQAVLQNISSIVFNKLHFVLGIVNDKDIIKILDMLPKTAVFYFCKPDIPRGLE